MVYGIFIVGWSPLADIKTGLHLSTFNTPSHPTHKPSSDLPHLKVVKLNKNLEHVSVFIKVLLVEVNITYP